MRVTCPGIARRSFGVRAAEAAIRPTKSTSTRSASCHHHHDVGSDEAADGSRAAHVYWGSLTGVARAVSQRADPACLHDEKRVLEYREMPRTAERGTDASRRVPYRTPHGVAGMAGMRRSFNRRYRSKARSITRSPEFLADEDDQNEEQDEERPSGQYRPDLLMPVVQVGLFRHSPPQL